MLQGGRGAKADDDGCLTSCRVGSRPLPPPVPARPPATSPPKSSAFSKSALQSSTLSSSSTEAAAAAGAAVRLVGRSVGRTPSPRRSRSADDCLATWRVREAVNVNQDRLCGIRRERERGGGPFFLNWPLATSLLELLLPTSTNDCRAVANLP